MTVGILCMLICFTVLFSWGFIAAEAQHDCEGEDCEICLCIEQCLAVLSRIAESNVSFAPAPAFLFIILFFICFFGRKNTIAPTPVEYKVQLNN